MKPTLFAYAFVGVVLLAATVMWPWHHSRKTRAFGSAVEACEEYQDGQNRCVIVPPGKNEPKCNAARTNLPCWDEQAQQLIVDPPPAAAARP